VILLAVAFTTPFTVAVAATVPNPGMVVKVACTLTPGWVGTAPFNKVGVLVAVVGRFTENALVPKT
jgi:hypothetical protein